MSGKLFLIGTPIGNLGDVTLRAVETLKAVERLYAEDTRRTRTLLSHLAIEGKKLLSLHAHSSERAVRTAIEILESGSDVGLVTDAGMPSVSDPGSELVRAAHAAGVTVQVIPGPSAVTTAVAASGLVDGGFTFLGFLPRKGTKRAEALGLIADNPLPTVLFESPHRVEDTLGDLAELCGPRKVAICRELTKKFEEILVEDLEVVATPGYRQTWLGELTLVVEGRSGERRAPEEGFDLEERARSLLASGLSSREATRELGRQLAAAGVKMSRRDVYSGVLRASAAADADEPDEAGAFDTPLEPSEDE